MAKEYDKANTLLYGLDSSSGPLDCLATDISFDERGTSFVIHWRGERYPGRTPLLGRPALSTALGAFTMACALGAQPAYAVACMANLEPVDNRLVLDTKGQVAFLRDAYNSNPTGFEAALEVLGTLPASRRVLMTPGMIELGDQQYDQNRKIARSAAGIVDLAIIVGSINREALLAGFQDQSFPSDQIVTVDTRDEAFLYLSEMQRQGDLVLIENDLGDIHEGVVRF
jgi:UDP-N-acetylmuramoyl-tripeptide--D-alanyl-D-alanine ligase